MKSRLVFLIIGLLLVLTGRTQTRKLGPEGGILKQSGYYQVEVVDCLGYLEIYVYNLRMQPIRNHGFSGSVDFYYPDSTCATSQLYHYGVFGFTANPPRERHSSCEIFLQSRGIFIRASFEDLVCTRPDE